MEILICTDGSSSSNQSADLVAKFGFPATTRVVLLGVSDNKVDVEKINLSMDLLDKRLGGKYIVTRKIRYGNPPVEILAEALEYSYDLVVVGGGTKEIGLLSPKLGSTTSQLSRMLHTHFLVARNIPDEIGKILFCVGGEAPASETMTLGGAWISNTPAKIGLLHVIPFRNTGEDEVAKGRIDSKSASGKNIDVHDVVLNRARQQLLQAGVKNDIIPRIRQGLIVEEALVELSEGAYELLVIGAHYQPGQDLWKGTLFDDIADQLLNRSNCSVLII